MPTTIEELDAAIQDYISQANSIVFLNRNILQEYEDRERQVFFYYLFFFWVIIVSSMVCISQIEAISAKLEADNKELQRCLADIDALKVSKVFLHLVVKMTVITAS